ncbi:hypothetical protein GCM10023208_10840 [Erythrobacter westpacificensis]|uniref:Uncharacterized protein n=2 Tax=Erythrobacter westpacificensis TaxID=1055231 RepID=A0ABP9K8L5_9SPHN
MAARARRTVRPDDMARSAVACNVGIIHRLTAIRAPRESPGHKKAVDVAHYSYEKRSRRVFAFSPLLIQSDKT